MDDLLIFAPTFEKHIENLKLCLERARERNLKFRPLKCELYLKKIEFLGHEVFSDSIHTSSKKVVAINKIATPKTAKNALSFICLASYYRRFI
jgi:hypothetical protein